MATAKAKPLQQQFLDHLEDREVELVVFLSSGVKLQGRVVGHDQYCLVIEHRGLQQLVYKHALATVLPAQPVNLWEQDPRGNAEGAASPGPRAPYTGGPAAEPRQPSRAAPEVVVVRRRSPRLPPRG